MSTVFFQPTHFAAYCEKLRTKGQRIAFVPTMGALHAGHAALISEAKAQGDACIVSIFVNPTQFNQIGDLQRYPKTFEADLALCKEHGVDAVFAPEAEAMYPTGFQSDVHVTGIAEMLEGKFRPGHFDGVCTILVKLFNLSGPCIAIFGQKDFQQCQVVRRMVTDLNLPVLVKTVPTVRDKNGLALSSRNALLDPELYKRALAIPQALRQITVAFDHGQHEAEALLEQASPPLRSQVDKIDYFGIFDQMSMAELSGKVRAGSWIGVAAHLGSVRLIDNMVLGEASWTCT